MTIVYSVGRKSENVSYNMHNKCWAREQIEEMSAIIIETDDRWWDEFVYELSDWDLKDVQINPKLSDEQKLVLMKI